MLFPLLLVWFFVELLAFVAVARAAGVLGTLLLVILTSLSGFFLLRGEGLALAARFAAHIQRARRTGELPPLPLAQSLPRFIAGVLLLLPGFANDALAIAVLLPPLSGWIVRRVERFVAGRQTFILHQRRFRPGRGEAGEVIDIEGEVVPDDGEGDGPPELPPPPPPGPRPADDPEEGRGA